MVAINTRDDLIRLIKEDDELKELLREMVSETVLEVQKETLEVQQDILAEIREIRADTNSMRVDIRYLVEDSLEQKARRDRTYT